jgi:cytochrome b6-f complex iron-sulfur subunit
MAKRTPEEVKAQREAWLARKTARESGQDVPRKPPTYPGEEEAAPSIEPAETPAASEPAAAEAPVEPEPVEEPVTETAAEALKPQSPSRKRTPEEIKAQREAFLAARAAKAAGAPAPTESESAPADTKPAAPAKKPAAKKAPAKAAAKPKTVTAPATPAETPTDESQITRRELLNYAWLASIALFSVELVGLSLWFAFPNFKAGEFGGEFRIGPANELLPEVNAGPEPYTDGKFWLVNVDTEVDGEQKQGVLAIYKVCTHLGCLFEWVPMTHRFECPCHGSKFALSGDYIAGPARRSLDRFVIQAVSPDGSVKTTDAEGSPLVVDENDSLIVDTGQRILGSSDITPA